MTAPDPRRRIDCSGGRFVVVIDEVQSLCGSLFVKNGKLWRTAPDGFDYVVTAIWFKDFLMRQCVFVEGGRSVRPPPYLYPHVKSRLGVPGVTGSRTVRYPHGIKPHFTVGGK